MVVLKELILTVSTFDLCSGLERTDFNSFYLGGGSGGVKKTDYNSF